MNRTSYAFLPFIAVLFVACGDSGGATEATETAAASTTESAMTTTSNTPTTSGSATDTTGGESTTATPTTAGPDTGTTTTGGSTDPTAGTSTTGGGDTVLLVPGFEAPESVFWSADEQAWFVSNISGEPGMKDGNGFISKLNADGTVAAMKWVEGLDGPTGLRGADGMLYVADVDRLHAIDIATAKVTATVTVDGTLFLNDVTVELGIVYASDTFGNTIHGWTVGQGVAPVFMDDKLDAPNGLIFKNGELHVAAIGSVMPDMIYGEILRPEAGSWAPIGAYQGKLDGIELDGDDFLVTEFGGKLQRVSGDGATVTLIRDFVAADGMMSTADFGFDPVARVVAVPDLYGGVVAFYALPD